MFTGIIEELGTIKSVRKTGMVTILEVGNSFKLFPTDIKIGDSISVNGVCLTVVRKDKDSFSFEVMNETLKLTNLNEISIGKQVNLERALKVGDRLSGHFVTGHIDCLGIIRKKVYIDKNLCFEINIPHKFICYVASKASIAIDGISLTVVGVRQNNFTVYIIPHTLKNTTLNFKGPSDKVNIECDILAKYAKF
ncbi:MAG: riboflavin synthase [Candidatus Omnitrophota bacterium]